MIAPRRNALWLILVLAVIIAGAERIVAAVTSDTRLIAVAGAPAPKPPPAAAAKVSTRALMQSARLVPLYPAGSLVVERPRKPSPKPGKRNSLTPTTKMEQPPWPAPSPAVSLDGELPAIEVAYDGIGFERYLDVSERIGRFFVLVERADGRTAIGPEISLRSGTISPDAKHGMAMLATDRPHLVSGDAMIRQRLSGIRLPHGAKKDSLLLFLNKPFDALLWDSIAGAVGGQGLKLAAIERINGRYLANRRGVFLHLDAAVTRADGRTIRLDRFLRVTL